MEKELEQFQQDVERQRAGRKGGSGLFPEALRAFAVRYLAPCLEKGDTVQAVVKLLGVSGPTLQAWRQGRTKSLSSKARPSAR
jgi:transposase